MLACPMCCVGDHHHGHASRQCHWQQPGLWLFWIRIGMGLHGKNSLLFLVLANSPSPALRGAAGETRALLFHAIPPLSPRLSLCAPTYILMNNSITQWSPGADLFEQLRPRLSHPELSLPQPKSMAGATTEGKGRSLGHLLVIAVR